METLSQYNDAYRELLDRINSGAAGVACDKCGTEMVYTNPGALMMSFPPKRAVRCPSCSHQGYKLG